MIAKIRGALDYKGDDFLIVDTGPVGYQVFVSQTTKDKASEEVVLYTLEVTRQEQVCLVGFLSLDERWMFEKLVAVQGVGMKVALGIMSTMSVSELAYAIINKEKKKFKDVDGIGDKLAERLILELKGKIDPSLVMTSSDDMPSFLQDIVAVLISLGYPRQDAMTYAKEALDEHPDIKKTGEILKHILKKRSPFQA